VIAIEAGQLPCIALGLASSFGVYGLLKSMIPLTAAAGVGAEGLVLAPFAVAVVVAYQVSGAGTLTGHGVGHVLLLMVSGPVTAVPLMLYGAAARRVPLSTIGVLMYLNPILQFLWGVLAVGEPMPPTRWIGFVLVWIALVVFTVDLVRTGRATDNAAVRRRRQAVRSTT
jgi:chloramphenicol-sensitive protein RarD